VSGPATVVTLLKPCPSDLNTSIIAISDSEKKLVTVEMKMKGKLKNDQIKFHPDRNIKKISAVTGRLNS
jgi:hypothetical protein